MGAEYYDDDDCVAAGEYLVDFELGEAFSAAKACVGESLETQMREGYDNTQEFITGDLKGQEAEALGYDS